MAKSEVEAAGPLALAREAHVCAIPFTAPKDRFVGGAAVMYVKTVAAG
jgi:hypothetical protein